MRRRRALAWRWLALAPALALSVQAVRAWAPGLGAQGSRAAAGMLVLASVLALAAVLAARRWRPAPRIAGIDAVTGLQQEVVADAIVRSLMARDDRAGSCSIVLVIASIDRIDALSERYGRDGVDAALRLVGAQVRGQARAGDVAARLDGDRIGVFIDGSEIEQAETFARRIAMLLGAQQLAWRGDQLKLTLSIGLAARQQGETLEALKDRADQRRRGVERGGGAGMAA
jgi:diguanylate cyclase (GGDEF)-like protein